MTSLLHRPDGFGTTTHHPRRRRRPHRPLLIALAAVVGVAALAAAGAVTYRVLTDDSRRDYLAANGWPAHGQAALRIGIADPQAGPHQHPAPIASLAKVMTAYLVLHDHPLAGTDGPDIEVTDRDVADTARRRDRDESVVALRSGERLSERDALLALLLPSANNVAVLLARWAAGDLATFVQRMNATARLWGMRSTTYTDPSGYDDGTRSTAADQLRLATAVTRLPEFNELVATRTARIPVAGTIRNTDLLLGRDGFVGVKTGSDDAAGGCFMFRTRRVVAGRTVDVLGVVLGQPGRHLLLTGQYAARQLAHRVAPAVAA